MTLSIGLYSPVKQGNAFLANITDAVRETWKHSKRRIGGDWIASCEFRGSRSDMDDLFFDGLLRDVRVTAGGLQRWRGFIGAMSYLRDGVLWNLTLADRANAVKLIYTRLGDNMLTNGSAESGAWSVVNGATVTQSTTWVTDGTYSCKIVVADTAIRGADIQSSITIVANAAYEARVSLHVISGSWRVAINRTDTDEKIAAGSTKGATGDLIISLIIKDTNTYAGTVRFRITSEASAGTIYGDGAIFRTAPSRAETDWKTDLTSINQFGRIENVVLDMSLTSSAANSKAQTLVNTLAWPTVTPPDEYTIGPAQDISDRLQLSLMGYIFTAGWRYCPLIGTTDVTAIIQALIATQSDYLVEGTIDQNDMEYQIDDRLPLSLWTVASEAALAGDETGARWSLLCHNQREIDYLPTSLETLYHLRNNRIYNLSGTELEPWEIEPAWMELHDAPQVSQVVTGSGYDELQRIYLDEVEYSVKNGVTFRQLSNG